MGEYAITTQNLVKVFGKFKAVNNINLKISRGVIHGFVGPNGAGKTTTIKMLIGAMIPTSGDGKITDLLIGTKESRKKIGYVPEKSHFYKDMNAIEYLIYMGQLSGMNNQEAINKSFEMLNLFGLIPFMYKRPIDFSSGMKKKLTFAQALMHDPEILILDEPTANLDPESRMFIIENLRKLVNEKNLTVFISSHILTELELIVDEVTLIDKGKIILTGNIATIRNRFNQGVFEVDTSDNELLISKLNELPFVDEVKIDANGITKVYTKETNKLKTEIIKIIYELGLSLNRFTEEKITLDSIYKSVFSNEKVEVKL